MRRATIQALIPPFVVTHACLATASYPLGRAAPILGWVLRKDELESALSVGYESRAFEFKGSGSCDEKYFLAKVARAGLSMGNLRDGGYVVIGIDDTRPEAMLPGLSDADCEGWLAYDDVSARLAAYCDPPLTIELASFSLGTDARVIVLHVREFADIPHLCARDYPDVLRKGALGMSDRDACPRRQRSHHRSRCARCLILLLRSDFEPMSRPLSVLGCD